MDANDMTIIPCQFVLYRWWWIFGYSAELTYQSRSRVWGQIFPTQIEGYVMLHYFVMTFIFVGIIMPRILLTAFNLWNGKEWQSTPSLPLHVVYWRWPTQGREKVERAEFPWTPPALCTPHSAFSCGMNRIIGLSHSLHEAVTSVIKNRSLSATKWCRLSR